MILSILLIGSIAFSASPTESDPYAAAECWTLTGIGQAPQNTDLEVRLAPVRAVPGGVLFPAETARHVLWRLHCLQRWPEVTQIKLDELATLALFDRDHERAIVEELRTTDLPVPRTPWAWYIGLTAGGVAAGLILGLVLGG